MPKNVGSIKTCSAEYPVGVGCSRLGLKPECAGFFQQRFPWLLRHTEEQQYSKTAVYAATIQLCSFGVVLMSCIHVVRSALQYSACRV